MGALKATVSTRLDIQIEQLQTLRDELEVALVKSDRQRKELQALRDRAEVLMRDIQKSQQR